MMAFLTNSFLMMAAPQGEGASGGGLGGMLVPMALIFAIFYFMLIRPQQRRERERKRMITELRAGERVLFAGGLIGKIVEANEHTFRIQVADGVVLEVARGAVSRALKDGETAVDGDNA